MKRVALEAENGALKRAMAAFPVIANSRPHPSPEIPTEAPIASSTAIPAAAPAPTPTPVPRFHQIVDSYLAKYPKEKHSPMFKKHEVALPMLKELIGDIPITELKQAHINDFFSIVQKLPPRWKDQCNKEKLSIRELAALKHPKTISGKTFQDSYKASVNPFIEDSIVDWQDQGFPTTLKVKSIKYSGGRIEGEGKQRALKSSELKRLFEGPEMHEFAQNPTLAHCYWFPLIGLFTGARVNEVCQLNPQTDVLQDMDSGVWYFWITEETEGDERIDKSTKNDESRRKVPIHSKLLQLGFLDYLEKVKKSGAKLLFPSWSPSRGKASGEAEKWFRELLVTMKLRDETPGSRVVGFHAFRHTLENKGDNTKGLPWPIEHITGHAIPGKSKVSRGYSGELDIQNKSEILEMISFDVNFVPLRS